MVVAVSFPPTLHLVMMPWQAKGNEAAMKVEPSLAVDRMHLLAHVAELRSTPLKVGSPS